MRVDWLRKRSFQAPRANYMRSSGMVTWNQHARIYIYTRKKSTIIHMQTAHSEMVWRGGWSNETPTEIEGTATTIGGQLPSVQISGCWVVDQLPTFTPYYLLYFLHFKNTSGSWIYEMRYGYTYPPFLQVQSQQDAAQLDESKALGERS